MNTGIEQIEPVCENCGLCCNSYTFWMTNRDYEDDPKEIKRLISYHGCNPIRNKQGELGISIPMTCVHLGWEDGKSFCKINNTKPVVCREYFCEKVIKKALEAKLDGVHL